MYVRGNTLVRKFGKCSTDVKIQLFKTYLGNMYCSHLWSNYKQSDINKVKVAYNNMYRSLMTIRTVCSISAQYVQNEVNGFEAIRRNAITSFRTRILNSDNSLVCAITLSSHFTFSSQLQKTWCKLVFNF